MSPHHPTQPRGVEARRFEANPRPEHLGLSSVHIRFCHNGALAGRPGYFPALFRPVLAAGTGLSPYRQDGQAVSSYERPHLPLAGRSRGRAVRTVTARRLPWREAPDHAAGGVVAFRGRGNLRDTTTVPGR